MIRSIILPLSMLLTVASSDGAEPLFQTENIFPPGNKHAHSSSIIECEDGGLLVCWFYGSGERTADDVLVQGARRSARTETWTKPFLMADTPGFPDCNPVLFVDTQKRLWMFWITVLAERWECSQLKYRRAETTVGSGAPRWVWQDIINLKPGPSFATDMKDRFEELNVHSAMWAEYAKPYHRMLLEAAEDPLKRQTGWMTRTHPLTLPGGRILLPLYSDGFNASLMAISDDTGETWKASSPIVGRGPIQPTIARRNDGKLLAWCRDSGDAPGRAMMASSADNGESWTPAVDSEIPNPGSSLEVTRLADGRWLMIANDTERHRRRLTAMLSDDEGKTWSVKRQMEPSDEQGRSFGYPSVIQSRDGRIHVTYSYSATTGKCIRHAVLNTDWIETGD